MGWENKKLSDTLKQKDLGVDLDRIEDSEQLERYLSTFPNVILTNFTEFVYIETANELKISIARPCYKETFYSPTA